VELVAFVTEIEDVLEETLSATVKKKEERIVRHIFRAVL